jgi:signal transduction histidine kinase
MRKSVWIFLFAILVPSAVLGWLALRSAEEQKIILERQTTELYQRETESLAAAARAVIDEQRRNFAEAVRTLLSETKADSLASDFAGRLPSVWSRKSVGFSLDAEGRLLSPSTRLAANEPAWSAFLHDHGSFLGNVSAAPVYNVSVDALTQPEQLRKQRSASAESANGLLNKFGNNSLSIRGSENTAARQTITLAGKDATITLKDTVGQTTVLPPQAKNSEIAAATPVPAPETRALLPQSAMPMPRPAATPAPASVAGSWKAADSSLSLGGATTPSFPKAVPMTPSGSAQTEPSSIQLATPRAMDFSAIGAGSLSGPQQIAGGQLQPAPAAAPAPFSNAQTFLDTAMPAPSKVDADKPDDAVVTKAKAVPKLQPSSSAHFGGGEKKPNVGEAEKKMESAPAQQRTRADAPGAAGATKSVRRPETSAAKPASVAASAPPPPPEPKAPAAPQEKIVTLGRTNKLQTESLGRLSLERDKEGKEFREVMPSNNDDSKSMDNNRVVQPQQIAQSSDRAAISSFLPETAEFRMLAEGQNEGILARFVQDKLALIFWLRPAQAPQLIFGCVIEAADLVDLWPQIMPAAEWSRFRESPQYVLALLNDRAHPVAMSMANDDHRDWRRPFVASEVGEALPHWEAALYLMRPEQLQESAIGLRRTLVFLIVVMLGAIALGGWLVVADARRQLALAQQKTDFVSNVSHELKTPLTSIRMFAELMLGGRSDGEKTPQYLRIIIVEAARLTRLINNVLDFAKLERRQKRFDRKPLDLHEVVGRVWEGHELHLRESGFETKWEAAPPPYRVIGDEDALAQVLVNLLANAEKYCGDCKAIELHTYLDDGQVCVSVLDRGVGVPAGSERKIFEAFYRAHDSLSSGIQGSGLGLTLALRLAHEHGGSVEYRARDGGGSAFTLKLPLAPEPA